MDGKEFENKFNAPSLGYGRIVDFKSFGDIHAISYTFEDVVNGKVGLIVESGKQYDVPLNDIKRIR